ncbi:MAG: hypothetical protein M3Y27_17700 [Acidobacteriota bacterium]|nr:hypothetical protein [Acidobacteriota bacterium]
MILMQKREEKGQLSFICACGKKPIELKTLGCCRSCYDRRYRSLRFFGGLRERVLRRDRFVCRVCGANSSLVVHHRERRNEARLLVTLCAGCHMRLHHSYGFRHWLSGRLLRLWRELHQGEPVQLQLALENAAKRNTSVPFRIARMPGALNSGRTAAVDNPSF